MNECQVKKNKIGLFEVSLLLKGLTAAVEISGGLVIWFVNKTSLILFVLNLLQPTLSDDPRDFVSIFLVNSVAYFSISSKAFFAVYLLSHGIIKIILVVCLFIKKIWAYKVSIPLFFLLIIYEFYTLYFSYSLWLLILCLFDILILYLAIREYKILKCYSDRNA